MNILNKYFEHIFLITTSIKTERHNYIKKILKENSINASVRFAPYNIYCKDLKNIDIWGGERDDNSSYVSLTSAYYSIFSEMDFFGFKNCLIFEDDVCFEEEYTNKLQSFFENLPDDWDFLNLGYHQNREETNGWKTSVVNNKVLKIDVSWTTHAVAFKNSIVDSIIDKMNKTPHSIELILNYFTHIDKINAYTPSDIIFTQQSYRTNEIQKNKKFKSLIY